MPIPIVRKLTTVGDSKGITLPKSWIDYVEQKERKQISTVSLEESNGCLILKPMFQSQKVIGEKNVG
jgi:hypothetical protein